MMEKSAVPYDTMSTNSVSTESMFNKCCCCIPLRVGCFILGYITLFVNFVRMLLFLGITLYCGLKTHGFDHMDSDANSIEDEDLISIDNKLRVLDQQSMHILGWTLVIVTIFDLIWLAINIACLVGIHKKRPGPIRIFVAFATFRLVLTIASYMYQMNAAEGGSVHNIIVHCIDLGLTAYFILVYYIYAMRLEKEALQVSQVQVNDVSFVYPTKFDKQHLVI